MLFRSADERDENGKNEPGMGFTVVDHRGEEKPETGPTSEPEPAGRPSEHASDAAPPPINFTTFILSLSSSVLIQLGDIPDPFTGKMEKNLTAAHHTIDMLALLELKTKGNLDGEESRTLEAVLYDLRMRFLKASGRL